MAKSGTFSRLQSLRVLDVMNRSVVKVNAQQPMSEIAHQFFNHDISAAPVVDEADHCVGILSATDFLRRDAGGDSAARAASHVTPESQDIVSSYMTKTVRTISLHAPLLNAAILMNAEHIHRLPVVDENSRVVGMISTMDIVAAMINAMDEMAMVAPTQRM